MSIQKKKNAPLHLYTIKNMFDSGKLLRRAKERITKKRSRKGVFSKESRKIKADEFGLKQFSSNKDSKNIKFKKRKNVIGNIFSKLAKNENNIRF